MKAYIQSGLGYVKSIRTKGSFAQNASYSFLGYVIMFATQILFTPLISRIYSPAGYGVFSAITALSINIATLTGLRLENVIFIEKEEGGRRLATKTISSIALAVSLVLTLLVFIAYESPFIHNDLFKSTLIFFLPLLVFIQVVFVVTSNELVIKKEFKKAFFWGTPITIVTKIYSLAYGYLTKGNVLGLFTSDALMRGGLIVARVKYIFKNRVSDYLITSKNELTQGGQMIKRYRRFPLYELPINYLNVVAGQAHIYVLTYFNQHTIVGLVGMAFTILDAPARLLTYSLVPVFMQKSSELLDNRPQLIQKMKQLLLFINTVSILPFLVILLIGPTLFGWAFSHKWYEAGIYAAAFSVFYFIRMEFDVFDQLLSLLQEQRFLLKVSVLFNVIRITVLIFCFILIHDPMRAIIYWALITATILFVIGIYYYKFLKINSYILIGIKLAFLILAFYTVHNYLR